MEENKSFKAVDFSEDDNCDCALPPMGGFAPHIPLECKAKDDASRFEEIAHRMAETYRIKSHDYGNSYGDSIHELGLIAGFIPILHKCNRLKNLVKGIQPQVAESLRDTLLDMGNYCILFAMELDKMNGE